jgi:hypothetical protein
MDIGRLRYARKPDARQSACLCRFGVLIHHHASSVSQPRGACALASVS